MSRRIRWTRRWALRPNRGSLVPRPELIIRCACAELGLGETAFFGRIMTQEVTIKRQIVHYLLTAITAESYTAVGRWVNRSHATIINSVMVVMERMEREPEFARTVARIERACREGRATRAA